MLQKPGFQRDQRNVKAAEGPLSVHLAKIPGGAVVTAPPPTGKHPGVGAPKDPPKPSDTTSTPTGFKELPY